MTKLDKLRAAREATARDAADAYVAAAGCRRSC